MSTAKGRVSCLYGPQDRWPQAIIQAHAYRCHCGIRRDEEGTRAKERVFSPRGEGSEGISAPATGILEPFPDRPAGR